MIPNDLLPIQYQALAFIAGGYAACPALAGDMDVWVRVSEENMVTARQIILNHLEANYYPYEMQENTIVQQGVTNVGYAINILKVAAVTSRLWSHVIHIMVTSARAKDLIEGFDISTHQVALTVEGVIKGDGWTSPTEPPRVLKMTTTTPERLAKIAARFGHGFTPAELVS